MEYLHTRQPSIYHGDLKSVSSSNCFEESFTNGLATQLNILVNSSHHAVITDFGCARSEPNANAGERAVLEEFTSPKAQFDRITLEFTLTGPLGTIRWAAPEVLAGRAKGLPNDMWAIGWICWEVSTVWAKILYQLFDYVFLSVLSRLSLGRYRLMTFPGMRRL